MIQAQIRAAINCVAFIKTNYGKKDPNYADFLIRQQQEILWRLNEQLTKSEYDLAAQVK
jgi:hypothetical protein